MACKTSFELHHNFPKLAEESGFTFNTHKPRVHIEWNKIKLIDIESLIRERKFVIVEQHINDILDCVLESEFDVRILDDGVLKIFRLAQLAVEYQQFCRHYLDRSVYVLREEVTNLLKELDTTKRNLIEKEEEIRRVRRKNKQYIRTPLPYGNENIATMLLKTLNQNKGDMLGSPSQADVVHHNKCNYCEKVFLNQLYLKSHISRRHANVLEIPQKDTTDKNIINEDNNPRVNEEIAELKQKLKQMEELIVNTHNYNKPNALINHIDTLEQNNVKNNCINSNENAIKEMKDAEVLTNEDEYLLDKIQEWKKEEYEKYNKEISLLRNQIIDIVSKKEKEDQSTIQKELKIMEQLQMTIKQQGAEIIALKQELLKEENNEKEKHKEIENQMSYWIKHAEMQSNEHKALLQKLNEVANEARAYKAEVEAEKEKSIKLQELLQERSNREQFLMKNLQKTSGTLNKSKSKEFLKSKESNTLKTVQSYPTADLNTLKKLQQKAQELLNIDQISSTDSSSTSDEKSKANLTKYETKTPSKIEDSFKYGIRTKQKTPKSKEKRKKSRNIDDNGIKKVQNLDNTYEPKSNSALHITKKENGYVHIPGSPIKVVRAKITEEVNHRLTSLGVDPLKNRIPQHIFQKQRTLLQKQRETKTKKLPMREKVLHSIITHLDKNISSNNVPHNEDYISPSKSHKTFSLSSMFTNVKTKALSLVKSNDSIYKSEKSYNDVAKRAMALLKTPPGSRQSSPLKHNISEHLTPDKHVNETMNVKKEVKNKSQNFKTNATEIYEETDTNDGSDITTADDELPNDRTIKTINYLIKSPIRRPDNASDQQYRDDKSNPKHEATYKSSIVIESDDIESIEMTPRKCFSQENINNPKQTKGVLKNASSTSSLNKKKVLFDMDAIQMKSLSASPSQSITEKSENNDEQLESGVVNLETEEWDISSIENEPSISATKVQVTSHISPKIAELKKNIELKLNYRSPTLSTALVGGVDVMAAPMQKGGSLRGSNTSLGSSILDETDNVSVQNNTFFRQSKIPEKDDSEIEISDLINDAVDSKHYIKSF